MQILYILPITNIGEGYRGLSQSVERFVMFIMTE